MMRFSPSLHSYFHAAWISVASMAFALAWESGIVTLTLAIPLILFTIITFAARPDFLHWPRLTLMLGIILYQLINSALSLVETANFAQAFGEMAVVVFCASLMWRENPKGHWLSYLLALLIGTGSVIVKSDLIEYILFILLIMSLIINLNASYLFFAIRRRDSREQLAPRYFLQLLSSLPAGFILAALVFMLFPRLNSLAVSLDIAGKGGRTGYSGSISLTGGGRIQESQALVFRVQEEGGNWLEKHSDDIYFRGNALDRFAGNAWYRNPNPNTSPAMSRDLRLNTAAPQGTHALSIFYEPLGTRQLFYPGNVQNLVMPPRLWDRIVTIPGSGEIMRADEGRQRLQINMVVTENRPLTQVARQSLATWRHLSDVANDNVPFVAPYQKHAGSLRYAREIPAAIRHAPYFRNWVANFTNTQDQSLLSELLNEISTHFQRDFQASLINDFSANTSLEEFLSKTRRGHCEYFATATTLLLRELGIPSRVVLGYRGGRFNDQAQALEVRELNAHAWVEIYVPAKGWFPFDAMPYVAPEAQSDLMAYMSNYASAASFWFHRYVVDYNMGTQLQLMRDIRDKAPSRQGLLDWRQWQWSHILVALCAVGLLLIWRWWQRRPARSSRYETLPAYYKLFLRTIHSSTPRQAGETYRTFHARLTKDWEPEALIMQVDRALEADLYSRQPSQADDWHKAMASMKRRE